MKCLMKFFFSGMFGFVSEEIDIKEEPFQPSEIFEVWLYALYDLIFKDRYSFQFIHIYLSHLKVFMLYLVKYSDLVFRERNSLFIFTIKRFMHLVKT